MAVILKPLRSQNIRMNILIFKEKKRPLMVSMTSIITFYTNYILTTFLCLYSHLHSFIPKV